jgi:hypothetical protein
MSQWNRLRQPVVLNHSVEELKAAVSSTISEFMKLENSFTMAKGKNAEGHTTIYNTYIIYIALKIYNHIFILDLQVLLSTNKHFEKI